MSLSNREVAEQSYAELARTLDAGRFRRDEPLAPYTTFKIGGPADLYYEADSADDLAAAVVAVRRTGLPYFVLGLGANILVGDRGFRGLVIRNVAKHFRFSDDGKLWVESGAVMADIIPQAVERGWSGLEHYVGIPSTVGGAVWQNLHFLSPAPERGRTMFVAEVFDRCELLTEKDERKVVDRDYMKFGYDTCILHFTKDIVTWAEFQLTKGNTGDMHRIIQE
ncbi:MAG: FAD-binding protein, partial [Gemmatimonadaceae bacterium]